MTKGDTFHEYNNLSAGERRSFDRWLRANAVIASIFAAGILAMAFAGGPSTSGPRTANAQGAAGIDVSAVAKNHVQNEILSVQELMLRIDLDTLSEQRVDEPY